MADRRRPVPARSAVPAAVRKRLEAQLQGAPFVRSVLQARLTVVRAGAVHLEMTPRPSLHQYQGLLQGGVLTGFADAAATFAVNSLLAPEEDSITVQLSMSFFAPAGPGPLVAVGRTLHRGRRTAVASAEIRDARGRVTCRGTFTSLVIATAPRTGAGARAGAPRRRAPGNGNGRRR